jgi:hypothetical protein
VGSGCGDGESNVVWAFGGRCLGVRLIWFFVLVV